MRSRAAITSIAVVATLALALTALACGGQGPASTPGAVHRPEAHGLDAAADPSGIARYCRNLHGTLASLDKLSRTVDTGTDGGGGIRLYRRADEARWVVLGVLLSSSYVQMHFCFDPSGRLVMVDERQRWFEVDRGTGELVLDLEEIEDAGTRFYYLSSGEMVADDRTQASSPESQGRARTLRCLADYLVDEASLRSGWARLPLLMTGRTQARSFDAYELCTGHERKDR
jgi:hypothetical protein